MNTNLTNAASSSASTSATQNAGACNLTEGSSRDLDAATLAEMGEAMLPLRQMFAKFNTDVGRRLRPESDMSPEDFRTTVTGELLKVAKLLQSTALTLDDVCVRAGSRSGEQDGAATGEDADESRLCEARANAYLGSHASIVEQHTSRSHRTLFGWRLHRESCPSENAEAIMERISGPREALGWQGVGLRFACGEIWRDPEHVNSTSVQRAIEDFVSAAPPVTSARGRNESTSRQQRLMNSMGAIALDALQPDGMMRDAR